MQHMRVEDLMADLNVSRSYAYRLTKQPDFPAIRIPALTGKGERDLVRIPRDRYEAWKEKMIRSEALMKGGKTDDYQTNEKY